ncbi:MAG: TonB-dependent receptor [bacterium]|nr:TonB-dependent receptor [bacterium]
MKTNKTWTIMCVVLFLSFFILPMTGEEEKDVVDDVVDISLDDLLNIKVTTASKTAQSLSKVSATMVVITSEMIKQRGYHHLEEILHDLPGFDFNKGYGVNYSTIFMRGYRSANSDRFILMYDGILENDIWKQTNWISRQYPVTQIKQIEILYGPASALYGTNAFSGIINVITKKHDEIGEHQLTMGYGSWGRRNLEFSSGKQLSDNIGYNFAVKYFGADDLHPWDYMKLDYSRDFSDAYKTVFDVPYVYKEGNLEEGDIDGKHPYDDFGIHANFYLGNLKFTALNWTKKELEGYWYNPFKRRGEYTEWFENNQGYKISHQLTINEKATLNSSLMFRSHRLLDSWEVSQKYYMEDDLSFKMKAKSATKGYGEVYLYNLKASDIAFEEQLTYDFSDKFNLIGGFKFVYTDTQEGYNEGTTKNNIQETPRHNKRNYAGFAQAIIKASSKMDLTVGGRYEVSRDENGDGYDVFTPRVSMVFTASSDIILRLQYAEAFQEPDDWHKFALDPGIRDIPSPNLDPEKLKAFEFGTTIKLGNKILLFGSVYYNIIDDLILPVDDGPGLVSYHWENAGKSKIFGYEVSMRAGISDVFSLNGNISGAFNRDEDDNELGDIAPVKVNLGLLYNRTPLSVYAKVNYVSSKNTINHMMDPLSNPIYTSIDGYSVVGLNVKYSGIVKGLDLNVKLDNVFDTEYYNPGPRSADGVKYNARVMQPGFNFMIGLTYSYQAK